MKNRQIKKIAKYLASDILRSCLGTYIGNELEVDDLAVLQEEINKIADRISELHGFGTLENIINYVLDEPFFNK